MDEPVKPFRTRGTPAYRQRAKFGLYGSLFAGVLGLVLHFSGLVKAPAEFLLSKVPYAKEMDEKATFLSMVQQASQVKELKKHRDEFDDMDRSLPPITPQ